MTSTAQPRTITQAEAERMADKMLWKRLATDSAYQNAMDANAQYSREERIGIEIWADIEDRYEVQA
jgi:hypothetical protein